jgi:endonuclease/exonuclease/phosphatase family metal-dependent hydrolase
MAFEQMLSTEELTLPSHIARAVPAAAIVAILAGCNGNDDPPLKPVAENPFRALVAGTDSTLDIATWNVHDFAEAAGAETVGLVAEAIRAMNLDVVALQEIQQAARFDELVNQLPGWAGYLASSGGEWRLAYLWRTDTVTAGPGAIHEIYTDQNVPFPRAPLVFDLTYDGRSVLLINNHLKCCGDGSLDSGENSDEEYRRYLAGELLESWIATAADGRAVVMVGDLNDKLDDAVVDNVFQMFLDLPARYRFADWDLAVGPQSGWSWRSPPEVSHLDHILVTDELFAALGTCRTRRLDLALASGVFADKVSDHAPVVVTLDLDAVSARAR